MGQPLPDLIADIERTLGLDIEIQLGSPAGRAHLDAFAAVVSDVASTGAGPGELLDYLDAAAEREDGLAPGEVPASSGRVQVLTIHAAKGLEWEIVAVPHLTDGVFPNSRGGTWLGDAAQLPPILRGDRADLPSLALPPGGNQKDLADALAAHTRRLPGAPAHRGTAPAVRRAHQGGTGAAGLRVTIGVRPRPHPPGRVSSCTRSVMWPALSVRRRNGPRRRIPLRATR